MVLQENPKPTWKGVLPKDLKGETKEQGGLHEGVHHVAGHTLMWGPKIGPYPSMSSPRSFGAKPQKVAFQKKPKSTFTIHDDIFQRLIELKIFMWA